MFVNNGLYVVVFLRFFLWLIRGVVLVSIEFKKNFERRKMRYCRSEMNVDLCDNGVSIFGCIDFIVRESLRKMVLILIFVNGRDILNSGIFGNVFF